MGRRVSLTLGIEKTICDLGPAAINPETPSATPLPSLPHKGGGGRAPSKLWRALPGRSGRRNNLDGTRSLSKPAYSAGPWSGSEAKTS